MTSLFAFQAANPDINLWLIAPELIVVIAGVVIMMVDAFAPRNFSPVVPAQAQAAAKPTVPPLPFRYIGRMQDGDKLAVFLMNGNESVAVAAGDRIGDYRVEKVTDAEIVFTYLPMKAKQTLTL